MVVKMFVVQGVVTIVVGIPDKMVIHAASDTNKDPTMVDTSTTHKSLEGERRREL